MYDVIYILTPDTFWSLSAENLGGRERERLGGKTIAVNPTFSLAAFMFMTFSILVIKSTMKD